MIADNGEEAVSVDRVMSTNNFIDPSCLVSAILFLVCNVIDIVGFSKEMRGKHNTWHKMKDLDLYYIKKEWELREDLKALVSASGIIHAIAWFSFCIPVVQVCWILSKGGKKRTQVYSFICMFALGSSVVELVAQFCTVGFFHASCHVASVLKDKLDDWNGWKTLELLNFIARGSLLWVDNFEYFALFVIMILIGLAVSAEYATSNNSILFGKKWAIMGAFIGTICLFEFLARVLRFVSWKFYMPIVITISVFNSVIALPIWLLILGRQLPRARSTFESKFLDQTSSLDISTFLITPANNNNNNGLQVGEGKTSLIHLKNAEQDDFL